MVSGVMTQLGIDMGGGNNKRWEDDALNLVMLKRNGQGLPDLVRRLDARNAECSCWGWKDPLGGRYLQEIWPHLRNPVLVLVFRDALSAGSWGLQRDKDPLWFVQRSLKRQMDNLKLVQDLAPPAALISYERATRKPRLFIDMMAEFLGVDPPEDKRVLVRFMKPGSYKTPSQT